MTRSKAIVKTTKAIPKVTAPSANLDMVKEHVNAIIQLSITTTLDAATGNCKCSVCKALRENARHVRALLNIGQRIKHIEVSK